MAYEPLAPRSYSAVDIEKIIIGSCLLQASACFEVLQLLKPEYFANKNHQFIFTAITNLAKKRLPIDIITVTRELEKNNKLDLVGGPHIISQFTNRVASSANIEYHCRIIIEEYIRRELIAISYIIQNEAQDNPDVISNLFATIERLNHLTVAMGGKGLSSNTDVAAQIIKHAKEMLAGKPFEGIVSPWPSLNEIIVAFRPQKLYIIAARPSVGKTALVLQVLYHAARTGTKCLLFSLEMSKEELVNRILSGESGIDSMRIESGKLSQEELEKLEDIGTNISNHLIIDDTAGLNIEVMRVKATNYRVKYGIQMIAVDYLQLMESPIKKYGNNPETELSDISKGLKRLAKELKMPVIALAQLSREPEKRKGGKPILSDLRGSGSMEQDADVVIFIYVPSKYLAKEEMENPVDNETELIIAKNRGGKSNNLGKTTSVYLQFLPHLTIYREIPKDLPKQLNTELEF